MLQKQENTLENLGFGLCSKYLKLNTEVAVVLELDVSKRHCDIAATFVL